MACLNSHKQLEKLHENLRDYISCQLKPVAFFYSQVSQGSQKIPEKFQSVKMELRKIFKERYLSLQCAYVSIGPQHLLEGVSCSGLECKL